jgi:hypothetical protein
MCVYEGRKGRYIDGGMMAMTWWYDGDDVAVMTETRKAGKTERKKGRKEGRKNERREGRKKARPPPSPLGYHSFVPKTR